jgi:hypothetical protein
MDTVDIIRKIAYEKVVNHLSDNQIPPLINVYKGYVIYLIRKIHKAQKEYTSILQYDSDEIKRMIKYFNIQDIDTFMRSTNINDTSPEIRLNKSSDSHNSNTAKIPKNSDNTKLSGYKETGEKSFERGAATAVCLIIALKIIEAILF